MSILSNTNSGYIKKVNDYIADALDGKGEVVSENPYTIHCKSDLFRTTYVNADKLPALMTFDCNHIVSISNFNNENLHLLPQIYNTTGISDTKERFCIATVFNSTFTGAHILKKLLLFNPYNWIDCTIKLTSDEYADLLEDPMFKHAFSKIVNDTNTIYAGDYQVDTSSLASAGVH